MAMPASTDYWINDRSGDPLFVITGEVNAALTKALPRLLREVRDVIGERRVTIVFDRVRNDASKKRMANINAKLPG